MTFLQPSTIKSTLLRNQLRDQGQTLDHPGRPPILTKRDKYLILRIVRKTPKIKYANTADGVIEWVEDHILYGELDISMDEFRGWIHKLVEDSQRLLQYNVNKSRNKVLAIQLLEDLVGLQQKSKGRPVAEVGAVVAGKRGGVSSWESFYQGLTHSSHIEHTQGSHIEHTQGSHIEHTQGSHIEHTHRAHTQSTHIQSTTGMMNELHE
jgi:hypothetical protein